MLSFKAINTGCLSSVVASANCRLLYTISYSILGKTIEKMLYYSNIYVIYKFNILATHRSFLSISLVCVKCNV